MQLFILFIILIHVNIIGRKMLFCEINPTLVERLQILSILLSCLKFFLPFRGQNIFVSIRNNSWLNSLCPRCLPRHSFSDAGTSVAIFFLSSSFILQASSLLFRSCYPVYILLGVFAPLREIFWLRPKAPPGPRWTRWQNWFTSRHCDFTIWHRKVTSWYCSLTLSHCKVTSLHCRQSERLVSCYK